MDEDNMDYGWRVKVFHCPFGTVIRNHVEVEEYKGKTTYRPWTEEVKQEFIREGLCAVFGELLSPIGPLCCSDSVRSRHNVFEGVCFY